MKQMRGKLLGNRYQIEEKVGEGGMASVYRGIDNKLNRTVAVKILYEQFASDPEVLRRFQKEAQAAAKLSHPYIVNVYDEGEEEGINYIIMEYLNGPTLKEFILRDGPLPSGEAACIAFQIADALVHAHNQGIIHRDIKPHNILLNEEGRVKVTDFGIARAFAEAEATITHGGSLLGSVYYSSPEQAKGGSAGEKSDIYSLGIVLYEMLTGKVPFSGESPVSVALKHLQENMPPPSRHVPQVSSSLEMIVMRATHKELEFRYASAVEFRNDLEEWLNESNVKNNHLGNTLAGIPRFSNASTSKRGKTVEESFDYDEYEDEEELEEEGTFPFKKVFVYTLLIALLFLGGWIGYNSLQAFWVVPEVDVPDVSGLSLEEARERLEEEGLGFTVGAEINSEEVPLDHVISQDPSAGRTVREGREIELVVSLGPEKIKVPGLVGKSEQEARILLSDLDLNMETSREYSSEFKINEIIEQNPREDFEVTRGETINIVVSKGRRPFTLLDFEGRTIEDAKEWLKQYDLVLREVKEEYSDGFEEGKVISQSPAPGKMVQSGDTVDLVVSKGRDPEEIEQTISVRPDVEEGSEIQIIIEDEEGKRLIYKGTYEGEELNIEGVGSGEITVQKLEEDEYITVMTKSFP